MHLLKLNPKQSIITNIQPQDCAIIFTLQETGEPVSVIVEDQHLSEKSQATYTYTTAELPLYLYFKCRCGLRKKPPSERESKLARLAPPPSWVHLLQLQKDESAISLRFSLPCTFPQNFAPGSYQSRWKPISRLLVLSQEIKMLFCNSCNLECIPPLSLSLSVFIR